MTIHEPREGVSVSPPQKVYLESRDLALALETREMPEAHTRLGIDPNTSKYGFYSFGESMPPGWIDCGELPGYPILSVREKIAKELYPRARWDQCQEYGDWPPELDHLLEGASFLRLWRNAAFTHQYALGDNADNALFRWFDVLYSKGIDIEVIHSLD